MSVSDTFLNAHNFYFFFIFYSKGVNLTRQQIVKLAACENVLVGAPTAALKRICLRSQTRNFEVTKETLISLFKHLLNIHQHYTDITFMFLSSLLLF